MLIGFSILNYGNPVGCSIKCIHIFKYITPLYKPLSYFKTQNIFRLRNIAIEALFNSHIRSLLARKDIRYKIVQIIFIVIIQRLGP